MPHSRHTAIVRADIDKVPELTVLAQAQDEAGVYAIANLAARQFFITGHAEYDPLTLKQEYERDLAAGLNPDIPVNYFPDDDPSQEPRVIWRSCANLLYSNWLNYFVYQSTPFDLNAISGAKENPQEFITYSVFIATEIK